MDSADTVGREIHEVGTYLEDVGTAAFAQPGSVAYAGVQISAREQELVVQVTCKARGAVEVLGTLWWQSRQPGLLNILRRHLLRGPLLWELRSIRARLDAVRVGHHPRWGVQHG